MSHIILFGYGSRFAQAGHRLLFDLLRIYLQAHQTRTADNSGLNKIRLLFRVVLNLVNDTFHMHFGRDTGMCLFIGGVAYAYVATNTGCTIGFTPR